MSEGATWLTAPEAAAILGVTVKELRLLIYRGAIPGYRYTAGGRVRLRTEDVRAYSAELNNTVDP